MFEWVFHIMPSPILLDSHNSSLRYVLLLLLLKAGGDDRRWDGWMASLPQWTWVWVSSGTWWRTGKPGVLQSMGSQRVRHDWATELKDLMRLILGSKHTVLGKLWVLEVWRVSVYALLLTPDEESKENWRGVALDRVCEALSRLQFWKLELAGAPSYRASAPGQSLWKASLWLLKGERGLFCAHHVLGTVLLEYVINFNQYGICAE